MKGLGDMPAIGPLTIRTNLKRDGKTEIFCEECGRKWDADAPENHKDDCSNTVIRTPKTWSPDGRELIEKPVNTHGFTPVEVNPQGKSKI